MIGEYQRSAKITLVANPAFRETTYVPAGAVPQASMPIAAALNGKKLPLVGRIQITVIEEGQGVWLAFAKRELDLLERLPPDFVEQVLANGKLRPDLAATGVRHEALLRPNTRWTWFNMEDPVVGGYTPEKIALRRAIGMGYDISEFIRVILKGRAIPANGPIPPTSPATIRHLKTAAHLYDPAAARVAGQVRTGTAMATATARPWTARRLARALSAPDIARATGRRAIEEEHGCDRPSHRVPEGPKLRSSARWRARAGCR
jgi:ABC-type transport system substrate-binding protein